MRKIISLSLLLVLGLTAVAQAVMSSIAPVKIRFIQDSLKMFASSKLFLK